MATILLTGGRAPVTLDLARLFFAQGHRVLVAESQSAQICRTSRAVSKTYSVSAPRQNSKEFIQQLIAIVNEEKVDVLIPTCEEVFYLAQSKAEFPSHCRVWIDDFKKISLLHDKWAFNQTAQQQGLSTPQSYLIRSKSELVEHQNKSGRWILKPAYSRFGNNIYQGSMEDLLPLKIEFAESHPWVLQQFIDGPEYCVYALAENGQLLALSIYSHAFVAGKAGICFQEIDRPLIEKNVTEYLKRINHTGQIAFDFIVEGGTPYALECNPRATSGIHLLTSEQKFAQVFTQPQALVNRKPVRAPIGRKAMLALAMLTFGISQITSLSRLRQWLAIFLTSHEVMFSWRDPVPFFDQLICMIQLAWQSHQHGIDLLSMSTFDIEWNGET